MDKGEQLATVLVKELIRNGLVAIVAHTTGGVMKPVLGPEARHLVTAGITFISACKQSELTWEQFRQVKSWKELGKIVVNVAAELLLENIDLFIQLALRIAKFISGLFTKPVHQQSISYKKQGTGSQDSFEN
uniref:Unkown protein n=1 Tax=Riptortus pedestris TaxID=329032 RepID=R4WEA1_RIPPE|nr:unkown protein [Riptortus pedestris]